MYWVELSTECLVHQTSHSPVMSITQRTQSQQDKREKPQFPHCCRIVWLLWDYFHVTVLCTDCVTPTPTSAVTSATKPRTTVELCNKPSRQLYYILVHSKYFNKIRRVSPLFLSNYSFILLYVCWVCWQNILKMFQLNLLFCWFIIN